MPVDIREASTLKCFKQKLEAHLMADQKQQSKTRPPGRAAILVLLAIMPVNFRSSYII